MVTKVSNYGSAGEVLVLRLYIHRPGRPSRSEEGGHAVKTWCRLEKHVPLRRDTSISQLADVSVTPRPLAAVKAHTERVRCSPRSKKALDEVRPAGAH